MAKGKKKNRQVAAPEAEPLQDGERNYVIMGAAIKDDFCHYSYEITHGVGMGDMHTVKGTGIVKSDMTDAMGNLNVHLAVLDDAFKLSGIEIEDIDNMRGHELSFNYHVTEFKIKGNADNESVILKGTKYVSTAAGYVALETPRVSIESMSSYKWYNELRTAVETVREEVALYKEGKYTPVHVEDSSNPAQMTIGAMIDEEGNGKTFILKSNRKDDDDAEEAEVIEDDGPISATVGNNHPQPF